MQMVAFYFLSPRVLRSIPYGLQASGLAATVRGQVPLACTMFPACVDAGRSSSSFSSTAGLDRFVFVLLVVDRQLEPALLSPLPILMPLQPRNRLDIYLPRKEWRRRGPRPTVIFVTGGAWTIGYKGRPGRLAVCVCVGLFLLGEGEGCVTLDSLAGGGCSWDLGRRLSSRRSSWPHKAAAGAPRVPGCALWFPPAFLPNALDPSSVAVQPGARCLRGV
jgi:hypothetical protein